MRIIVGWAIGLLVFVVVGGVPAAAQVIVAQPSLEERLLSRWQQHGSLAFPLPLAMLVAEGVPNEPILQSYRMRLDALLRASDEYVEERDDPERRAKQLFHYLHERVLRKYELDATLQNLVDGGSYNCVSATALYYLLGQRHGVPVTLMETPTHVYAVVHVGDESVRVEITAPSGGFDFDDDVERTVEHLLDYEFVTLEEVRAAGKQAIYDQFVGAGRAMEPEELVGIVYYNYGVHHHAEGNIEAAFDAYQNALLVEPEQEEYRAALKLALVVLMVESEHHPEITLPFLLRALQWLPDDATVREQALNATVEEADRLAMEERNFEQALALVDSVEERFFMADSTARGRLDHTRMRTRFNATVVLRRRGELEAAYRQLRALHGEYPDDPHVEEQLVHVGVQHALDAAGQRGAELGLALADSLRREFPGYPVTLQLHAQLTLLLVEERGLVKREPDRAETLLNAALEHSPEHRALRRVLSGVYLERAIARMHDDAYEAAEWWVRRGLEILPDEPYLLESLEVIQRFQDGEAVSER